MIEVPLTQGEVALIDDEDWPLISRHKWRVHRTPHTNYARATIYRNGAWRTVRLHRLLLGTPPGVEVDHIDHDGLNCRRANLREVTKKQNQQNRRGASLRSSTGVRGVSLYKKTQRFKADLTVDGRRIHMGYFPTAQLAEEAAILGRRRYMTHSPECIEKTADAANVSGLQ